jgi:uncharacterized protein DUF87
MKKLVVPREIFHQHVAILGKTRSGKSSVARLLVEDLLDRHLPVCIVDPKGDWWGIKLSADGKTSGYPVVIFGGEYADVPINEHAGKSVAELFATGNRPCLIDLGGWSIGARTQFWIDFASTLFRTVKGTHHLVVDEFHNFAPKGKVLDPKAGQSLHWANRLASEGLGKGIPMIFASQRPQKVHNDALTSAETLIAMRVLHPADRGAVADWIKGAGDASGAEVLESLAQLPRGEGWVWSPEIGFGPERVTFPLFATYDSFRPQTASDTKKLKGWAEVDLDDVRAKLATVVEAEKANDPRALRLQVAELRKEIAAKDKALAEIDTRTQRIAEKIDHKLASRAAKAEPSASYNALRSDLARHRRALESAMQILVKVKTIDFTDTAEDRKALEQAIAAAVRQVTAPIEKRVTALAERVEGIRKAAGAAEKAITAVLDETVDLTVQVARLEPFDVSPTKPRQPPGPKAPRAAPDGAASNGAITPKQQTILDALAELRVMGITEAQRVQVAFFAGYTNLNSKGFTNALGGLSTGGHLAYPGPGLVELTDAGLALAAPVLSPSTPEELQDRLVQMLGGASERILRPLIKAYPKPLDRTAVAAAAGYGNLNSKGFLNAIGRLRSLGFIDYPAQGQIVANPVLFLETR